MKRTRAFPVSRIFHASHRALLAGVITVACSSSSSGPAAPPIDLSTLETPPKSCAYLCPNTACPEQTTPYECDALLPWSQAPHDDPCPAWDETYPAVKPGACTASAPTGDAATYSGLDAAGHTVLADGHWLKPAGSQWVFSDLMGGMTSAMILIPSTTFALTVDTGYDDHVVRLVDVSQIASGADPTLAKVQFPAPQTLNSGVAVVPPDRAYVATDDGTVQALALDLTNKTLTRDDSRSLALPAAQDSQGNPANWYASGLATSPDGTKLIAVSVNTKDLLVFDVSQASPTFKQVVGQVSLGDEEAFGVWFDPGDPVGTDVYVSMWQGSAVLDVDVTNPAAPKVAHKYATLKDPEGIAFLDTRFFAVSDDLGDAITIVDRALGGSTHIPADARVTHYGQEPTALAFDPLKHTLYSTLSGLNAIAAYSVDSGVQPPKVTLAGRLPVGYWPSAIAAEPDGTVILTTLRGKGEGPTPEHFDVGDGDIADLMHGSIETIPAPSPADLAQGDSDVDTFFDVESRPGAPQVTCPQGAPNDFPVPTDTASGASPRIDHVFVIVRENKDYDALFGDFASGNGDADYVFKASQPAEMDQIWHNLRSLARTFAMSDNYYTDAIYSTQGHIWTTYGRANDFDERTWIESGDRTSNRAIPGGGIIDVGRPVEGSLFDWLGTNQVPYDILGEIVGEPLVTSAAHPPYDPHYPGGIFQNIGYNDLEKACYAAARVRGFCNVGNVVYMTLPNDHTFGVSAMNATPETYCAVNDEATGMFIDGLSHSPLWQTSLVMITEDDPSQGGEHVDNHRAPFVVISPFVKRGYVSHTHIDVSSMHKILAHVLGKPYPNDIVAHAGLPLDMFTSTPDYSPYTYTPRTWPLACGPASGTSGTAGEQSLTDQWDFSDEDSQPGLDAQVTRWMRGKPLVSVPDEVMWRVKARTERMHARDPEEHPFRGNASNRGHDRGNARAHEGEDEDDDDERR